jgi:hypothetical protein
MGRDYWKNVKELPLPKPIISYLEYSICDELILADEVFFSIDSLDDVLSQIRSQFFLCSQFN